MLSYFNSRLQGWLNLLEAFDDGVPMMKWKTKLLIEDIGIHYQGVRIHIFPKHPTENDISDKKTGIKSINKDPVYLTFESASPTTKWHFVVMNINSLNFDKDKFKDFEVVF
jgi:hypothetical protein